jgi:exopolysaccharide production protein ExoQ
MSPITGLGLCISFILVLFFLNRDKKEHISLTLWIPTIWALILGSRMVSLWFPGRGIGLTPEAYEEGSPMDRTIFLILIGLGLLVLIRRRINWSETIQKNKWLLLFLIFSAISIMWSEFPFVSLKRLIKMIGNLLMVLVIKTEKNQLEAFKVIIKRCGIILMPLSIILFKYYPQFGRQYHRYTGQLTISGVASGKNNLGILCMIVGIMIFWSILQEKKEGKLVTDKFIVEILVLIITMWLLIKANSATSTICFIVGISILLLMKSSIIKNNSKILIPLGLVLGLILTLLENEFGISEIFVKSLGRDMTFTGRTDFWKELLNMGTNSIVGTGYGSFWLGRRLEELWGRHSWMPTEAHNGYLEIYLELGAVGLILLGGVIIAGIRNVYEKIKSDYAYGSLWMCLLIITLLHNVAESSFRAGQLMYFIFLMIVLRGPKIGRNNVRGRRWRKENYDKTF